jgi:hypothetical protein
VLRVLRAFAWLRWRMLLNSIERTGSRDVVGRMSTAMEQLAPVVMVLVMLPSAVALGGAGGYAGWALARACGGVLTFEGVRLLLLAACIFAVAAPFVLPGRAGANPVRLLLLPIPRSVLFAGQAVTALAEPWLLLAAAPVLALPIGLATGGQPRAAGIALLAGALLLATLAGITLVVASAIELTLRNRRRGELLALMLFLLLPLIGVMAGLTDSRQRERRERPAETRAPPRAGEWSALERRVVALIPSESYALAVQAAVRADYRVAGRRLLVLTAWLALLQGLAFAVFVRAFGSPGVTGSRAGRAGTALAAWRLPGLSPAASAVAIGQLRLALRTPRGRFTLLSPLVMFMPFAAMLLRSPSGVEFAFLRLQSGVGLAAFTSFIALLAVLPFAMNQFAIDRTGFTLALLAPLETRTLLAGKAVGNGIVAAIPATVCIALALALFPAGDPALWISVPLVLLATYLLAAPVAAALSAVFPRSVDLNSIGRGSNAHGAAAFLGTIAYAAAGGASALPILAATALLHRPRLAPLLLLLWVAICATTSFVLFRKAAALFDRRREHLSMMR